MRRIPLITAALCLTTGLCNAAVNKCTDARGKVTYQDEPCVAAPQAAKVDTTDAVNARPVGPAMRAPVGTPLPSGVDAGYRSAKGAWRGPAQFNFVAGGVRSTDAHAIGRMVIELQDDGRVLGVVDGAGCKLSGLHTQFVTPSNASVDVTISGCADARFNARYAGHLVTNAAARQSKLSLSALATTLLPGRVTQSSIDAVLKR